MENKEKNGDKAEIEKKNLQLQLASAPSLLQKYNLVGCIRTHAPQGPQLINTSRGGIPFHLLENPEHFLREKKHAEKRAIVQKEILSAFYKKLTDLYPCNKLEREYLRSLLIDKGSVLPTNFYRGRASFLSEDAYKQIPLMGLFVKKDTICKGTLITLYLGERYTLSEWKTLLKKTEFQSVRQDVYGRTAYAMDVYDDFQGKYYVVDAFYEKDGTFARFINTPPVGEYHLFENTFFTEVVIAKKKFMGLFALRDILPGMEICASYGENIFYSRRDYATRMFQQPLAFYMEQLAQEEEWTVSEKEKAYRLYKQDLVQNPWCGRKRKRFPRGDSPKDVKDKVIQVKKIQTMSLARFKMIKLSKVDNVVLDNSVQCKVK